MLEYEVVYEGLFQLHPQSTIVFIELNVPVPPSKSKRNTKARTVLAQILRELRSEIRDEKTGRQINQTNFYAKCQALEGPPPDPSKRLTDVCFPAIDPSVQRDKISSFEGGHEPSPGQKRIYEQISGLVPNFLDTNFISVEDFRERRQLQQSLPSKSAPKPISPGFAKRSAMLVSNKQTLASIRNLRPEYQLTPGRRRLLRAINRQLRPIETPRLHIAVLQGQAGIGKSQVIAEWWKAHGASTFKENVFSLNCERKPGDQILRELTNHFLGEPGPLETALDAMTAVMKPLIILDGLVRDSSRLPGLPESELTAPTDADSVALQSVRRILKSMADRQTSASVLLAIQTDKPETDSLRLSQSFHAGVDYGIFSVAPLNDDDGAHMLSALEVRELSKDDLRRVSRQLMGLPISLVAAARYLKYADPLDREYFISQLKIPDRETETFSECFERYIALLDRQASDQEAHPHAFLRLLALMPGPVPKVLIDTVLNRKKISRLRNATLDKLMTDQIAFVADLGDRIDVHPLVRKSLRNDLGLATKKALPDLTTSREELAWIHATFAGHCLKLLPTDTKDFTTVEAENIEGAVYHLLALRDLLPQKQQSKRTLGERKADETTLRQRILDLQASSDEITRFCLDFIVARYFFTRDHNITRFLGQFETKARILTYFFDGHTLLGTAKGLPVADWRVLLLEIGICWMHAGRLLIANRALDACIRLNEPVFPATENSSLIVKRMVEDRRERQRWMSRSEAIATRSVIAIRQGRSADDILSDIKGDLRIALGIFEVLSTSPNTSKPLLEMSRAARRVIGRCAHVALLRGEVNEALDLFDRAVEIERLSGREQVVGDAGRRHIQALVRSANNSPDRLAEAEKILFYNKNALNPAGGSLRRQSNEIIPLLVNEAMLFRAREDYSAAEQTISTALGHRFIRTGECTFSARMELELERARLHIARGEKTSSLLTSLRTLFSTLTDTHHLAYAWECELLIAELVDPVDREEILRRCEINARNTGWLLRCADIEELREGRSAVRKFVC